MTRRSHAFLENARHTRTKGIDHVIDRQKFVVVQSGLVGPCDGRRGGNGLGWLARWRCGGYSHLLSSKDFEKELWFLTMTLFVAIGWENLLVSSGALTYASSEIAFGAAPAWILMLWLVFATTMNVGMQWLRGFWMFPVVSFDWRAAVFLCRRQAWCSTIF